MVAAVYAKIAQAILHTTSTTKLTSYSSQQCYQRAINPTYMPHLKPTFADTIPSPCSFLRAYSPNSYLQNKTLWTYTQRISNIINFLTTNNLQVAPISPRTISSRHRRGYRRDRCTNLSLAATCHRLQSLRHAPPPLPAEHPLYTPFTIVESISYYASINMLNLCNTTSEIRALSPVVEDRELWKS